MEPTKKEIGKYRLNFYKRYPGGIISEPEIIARIKIEKELQVIMLSNNGV